MRKALLVGVLAALGVAGAAYGAVRVTNVYTLHASIVPLKSGTKTKPVPIGDHIDWAVITSPTGYRPNIDKRIDIRIQGVHEHTNDFPACGSGRINDPTEGPATCPAGSQIGTGYFIVELGPRTDQSKTVLTCRVEATVYNGGNHTLVYDFYKGSPIAGQAAPCPLTRNLAFIATLRTTRSGLVENYAIPYDIRHVTVNGVTYDAAAITASSDTVIRSRVLIRKIKITKKTKNPTRTIKTKVGLFESISCPVNRQRQVAVTFTGESEKSKTVTRLVPCR